MHRPRQQARAEALAEPRRRTTPEKRWTDGFCFVFARSEPKSKKDLKTKHLSKITKLMLGLVAGSFFVVVLFGLSSHRDP